MPAVWYCQLEGVIAGDLLSSVCMTALHSSPDNRQLNMAMKNKTPPTDFNLWEGFCNNISKRKLIYFLLANALIPPATKSIEAIIMPDTSTIA